MNSGRPNSAELSGLTHPRGPPFFTGAALVFAGAVVYRFFLFGLYDSQPTGSPVAIGFYVLVSISIVLALVGAVHVGRQKRDLVPPSPEATRQVWRLTSSMLAGLSLTLVSSFFINGAELEVQETGFPLQFFFRTDFINFGPARSFNPLLAVLDFGFWLAISYLFLTGVPFRSRSIRGSCEALIGMTAGISLSVMVTGILYQTFNLPDLFYYPGLLYYPILIFFLNLAIGYVQIRRGFTTMGLAIVGTGILMAALIIMMS